eukprot:5299619-Pleurochrysis_carterae.AAC.2
MSITTSTSAGRSCASSSACFCFSLAAVAALADLPCLTTTRAAPFESLRRCSSATHSGSSDRDARAACAHGTETRCKREECCSCAWMQLLIWRACACLCARVCSVGGVY